MTEGEKKLINTFEARVRHFIYLHEELRKENDDLKLLLLAKDEEIDKISKSLKELQTNYANLKIAKALNAESGGDTAKTKQRLSNIVREIDKCIALLNN